MPAEEEIVREYFEGNGFLVRRLSLADATGKGKTASDVATFHVFNPSVPAGSGPLPFLLFTSELKNVREAIVVLERWPEARFTPAILKNRARLGQFLEKTVLKRTASTETAGADGPPRVLIVPGLHTRERDRARLESAFRARGIAALIAFRSMLIEVIENVETPPRRASDTLETLRMLRKYDLAGTSQLELF